MRNRALGQTGAQAERRARKERILDSPRVRIESGFYEGLEWPLDRTPMVIGRGRAADLVLHEATISRAHALLGLEAGNVYVQDLGSMNGTLVNGERQDRADLVDGDEISMGRLSLRILVGAGESKDA